jgi:ribosome-associated protein
VPRKPRRGQDLDAIESPGPDDELREGPSRTKRKNASTELQKLGEELLELRSATLDALALPELLREAIVEAKRLKSFGAKRRQLQYIGKLMRRLDEESIAAVEAAVRDQ